MTCSVRLTTTASGIYGEWEHRETEIIRYQYGRVIRISQSNTKKGCSTPGIPSPLNLSIPEQTRLSPGTPGRSQNNTTPNGSTIISSIKKPLKNTFLALEDLAFRTTPAVRNFLPWRTCRHAVPGVPLGRIIDPMAFKTDPPRILFIRWHCSIQLPFLVKRITPVFPEGI